MSQCPHRVCLAVATVCLAIVSRQDLSAQASASASQLPALKQLTLEELLEVDVTLPLRRPERAAESAAAVSVLTSEDIWRSGAVVLPEALRAAPGLFVGRFSNSSWIVTARGFASTSANKLLVMVDGRSVYSPLFSGVFWDQVDYPLADLDRIEVVRGPGAALWGSNAVNGVINVVSKHARLTQGTLITGGAGSEEHGFTTIRHGGMVGRGYYRVFGQFTARDDAHLSNGSPAQDWQRVGRFGTRLDFGAETNAVMVQGEGYVSRSGLAGRADIEANGAHVLATWNRAFQGGRHLQLHAYYDRSSRFIPLQFQEVRNTFDVELQHRVALAGRHEFLWGGGYRVSADDTTRTVLLYFDPEDRTTDLLSAFVQDEFTLRDDVVLTAGVRLEHNDYTGVEHQPTARIRWMPDSTQTVWGGWSRAVRLPTRLDTDVRITAGDRVAISGNPHFESETVAGVEGGYRVNPIDSFTADIAVFHQRYGRLRTQELPAAAGLPVTVGNGLEATSRGLELTARLQPREWVRLTGSVARLWLSRSLEPTSTDPTRGAGEAIDPDYQLFVQARLDLPANVEFDTHVRHVSELPSPGTPAYTEASVRVAWRPTRKLELSLVGRDILNPEHFEFISPSSPRRTALERAVFTRIAVAF